MFEIDYIGLIVSMVLLAAFIAPIYLNVRKNNKKKQALVNQMNSLALENGLKLQDIDSWRDKYIIGLDPAAKKLIYIFDDHVQEVKIIDLTKVQSVGIHAKDHSVGTGKDSYKVMDLLELQLCFHGGHSVSTTLGFYDGEMHSDLQNEYPVIKKWQQLLLDLVDQTEKSRFKKQPVHK